MRQAARRGRRRGCGCGGGILKLVLFLAFIIIIAYFVKGAYTKSDVAGKIRKTQYPIKYEHFVEKYADKYGLDKYLVYAVIRTESRFDRYAVSSADAKGLMQLTDETGRDCASKIGLGGYTADKLFDPETNIQLGCYYLNYLLSHYGGNRDVAIAAYNAGIGNVEEWLKNSAYADGAGGLAEIPFRETRNYVVRVNEAYEMYKTIYQNN